MFITFDDVRYFYLINDYLFLKIKASLKILYSFDRWRIYQDAYCKLYNNNLKHAISLLGDLKTYLLVLAFLKKITKAMISYIS